MDLLSFRKIYQTAKIGAENIGLAQIAYPFSWKFGKWSEIYQTVVQDFRELEVGSD